MKPRRVVLYARSATEKSPDEDGSVKTQLKALREYARSKGDQVLAEFADKCESGNNDNRPGLRMMMAAITENPGTIDAILVRDRTRLMRNLQGLVSLIEKLQRNGVDVIVADEAHDDAVENLSLGILQAVKHFMRAIQLLEDSGTEWPE